MQGPQVGDLQATLQMLLERGVILPSDEGARRALSAAIKRERAEKIYANATTTLVSVFQKERQLESSGNVDKSTADALNHLSDKFGAPSDQFKFVVKGT